ncbi:hypothetical protein RCL_jg10749.t1 [Rhizophagus clarus]|uniref:Uncharacterized protein n=1 Tax=Rhizophagus clarus TaxID=94130 RepID=A0A8H3LAK0_9GLOM|nr:hypothetical protein RCL_jg10749.t1 [Rhizophagus clarus]
MRSIQKQINHPRQMDKTKINKAYKSIGAENKSVRINDLKDLKKNSPHPDRQYNLHSLSWYYSWTSDLFTEEKALMIILVLMWQSAPWFLQLISDMAPEICGINGLFSCNFLSIEMLESLTNPDLKIYKHQILG